MKNRRVVLDFSFSHSKTLSQILALVDPRGKATLNLVPEQVRFSIYSKVHVKVFFFCLRTEDVSVTVQMKAIKEQSNSP